VTPEIKNFLLPIPSLDGRQVSVQVVTSEGYEQWILDLSTGSWSRPAQRGSQTSAAEWLPPDGREIAFFSNRDGVGRAFIQPADRSAPAKPLWPTERPHTWLDFSADGRKVILVAFDAPGLLVLDRESGEVRTVVAEGSIYGASFHPDRDWILYARRENRRSDLWLVPFPGPGEPRQITSDGGEEPQWSRDGDEIYYRDPTHFMSMRVEKSGGALVTGRPRALFEDRFRHFDLQRGIPNYAQHPNGRFLMIENAESREESLVLVENWRAKVVQAFARDGE
jgi:Tol biopolymer transport system component